MRLSEVRLYASSGSLFGGIDIGGDAEIETSNLGSFRQIVLQGLHTKLYLIAEQRGELRIGSSSTYHGVGGTFSANHRAGFSLSDNHVPLSVHAVERIEQLRNGRDLTFKVVVQASFLGLPARPATDPQAMTYYGDAKVNVARSDWVEKFLPAWGFHDLEIWEVRALGARPHPKLTREYERLTKAVRMLDLGEWDAAHKECREAVGALISQLKGLEGKQRLDKKVLDRLDSFLSLAVHLETAPDEDWQPNRQDAIMAVTLTKAVLDRVSTALAVS